MVAESYEVSPDHLTYTIKMRKDVTFSDGVPMTANDVKFSFDMVMKPENETMDWRNYYQDFDQCEVIDDYTVRFHAKKPYYRHLSIIGDLAIYPKHVYGTGGDLNTHPANRAPVGSGPYMFEKWDTNQEVVLKRNPNYWNKEHAAHLDKLVWRIMTDDDSSLQVFKRGDIDSFAMTPEQWQKETASPEFKDKFYTFTSLSGPGTWAASVTLAGTCAGPCSRTSAWAGAHDVARPADDTRDNLLWIGQGGVGPGIFRGPRV